MIITQNGKLAVTPFPPLTEAETGSAAFARSTMKTELIELELVFPYVGSVDHPLSEDETDDVQGSPLAACSLLPGTKIVVKGEARVHGKDVYTLDGQEFILLDEKLVVATRSRPVTIASASNKGEA